MARTYKYTRCRAVMHVWQDYIPLRKSDLGSEYGFRCTECLTIRTDVVSRSTGQLVTRSYQRPDDYKDDQPRTKADYRREFIRSLEAKAGSRSRRAS